MELANKSLLRELYGSYYVADEDGAHGSASSHWRHYGGLFDVELGDNDEPTKLHGAGFGHAKWGNSVHRLMDQACASSYLLHLQGRKQLLALWRKAVAICHKMGIDPTFDAAFCQVCALAQVSKHICTYTRNKSIRVLVIGDGFGVFSALFKEQYPDATLVLVDLGKTLFFQAYYCQQAHFEYVHSHVHETGAHADFTYCPADAIESLAEYRFDLAVNICSMQEMDVASIRGYFDLIRRTLNPANLFYCCNRERKVLPGGEITEIRAYPWDREDEILIDEPCPWLKYTFHWHKTENGPVFCGTRIPLVNYYDGSIIHRLAVMAV
jgi:hypothetical protein